MREDHADSANNERSTSAPALEVRPTQLARRRLAKAWSRRKLAAEAGIDPHTIGEIERGRRSAKPATIEKLATALGCEVVDIAEVVDGDLEEAAR
jgi:transcriptional regulator with XRE-family HTH domain